MDSMVLGSGVRRNVVKTIVFYLWLIAGIITLNSNGDISKFTYFLCWMTLMVELVCNRVKDQLTDEIMDEMRKED